MLSDEDITTIRESWRGAQPMASALPELLFRRLFDQRPDLRPLFRSDPKAHEARFLAMVRSIVEGLSTEVDLSSEVPPQEDAFFLLMALGRRHTELYGVTDDMWTAFSDAWMGALSDVLGPEFSPHVRVAWVNLIEVIRTTMRLGASSQVDLQLGRAL